jgi:hypothetical protein
MPMQHQNMTLLYSHPQWLLIHENNMSEYRLRARSVRPHQNSVSTDTFQQPISQPPWLKLTMQLQI